MEIIQTTDGSNTAYSTSFQQTYHSIHGAVTEARWVYLNGTGIVTMLQTLRSVRVVEVGFGLGLNFFLTADQAIQHDAQLDYIAWENSLPSAEDLRKLNYQEQIHHGELVNNTLDAIGKWQQERNELTTKSKHANPSFNRSREARISVENVVGAGSRTESGVTVETSPNALRIHLDANVSLLLLSSDVSDPHFLNGEFPANEHPAAKSLETENSNPVSNHASNNASNHSSIHASIRSSNLSQGFAPDSKVNAIYLDAFSPDQNPECWTCTFANRLYDNLVPGGMLSSYCVQGKFRRALESAGFSVCKKPGPPGKREVLAASKPSAMT